MTEIEYTSNDEFDNILVGDTTLKITGYVDSMLGESIVGRNQNLKLFKFILNNGQGRRVMVLLWAERIAKCVHEITYKKIIRFTNIKALPVREKFTQIPEEMCRVELSVQRNTMIEFLGQLEAEDGGENPPIVETVEIKYAAAYGGLKRVTGYVSVPFTLTYGKHKTYSFAVGAITDGHYKLRVQIANYKERTDITLGTHVTMEGNLQYDKYNSIYLRIENDNQIRISTPAIMGKEQLKNGFRIPLSKEDEFISALKKFKEDETMAANTAGISKFSLDN